MNTSSINNYCNSSIAAVLSNGLPRSAATNRLSQANGQLSPFAQMLNSLQQLQQANPAQYSQVMKKLGLKTDESPKEHSPAGILGLLGLR